MIEEMYRTPKIVDKALQDKIVEQKNKELLEKCVRRVEKEKLGKEMSRQESKVTSATTLGVIGKGPEKDRDVQIKQLIPQAAKVIRAHLGMPLHPSDLSDKSQINGITWAKLKLQLNQDNFDKVKFMSSLTDKQLERFNRLEAAQKDQGNLERLEKQSYNNEEDDFWLVMEMYSGFIEWLRMCRHGEIVEEDEKEGDDVDEEADEVLKLSE